MAIPDYIRKNFQTLVDAAKHDDLAIVECTDAVTGEPRHVLCAMGWHDGEFVMTPFGHLSAGNPYEDYRPPS